MSLAAQHLANTQAENTELNERLQSLNKERMKTLSNWEAKEREQLQALRELTEENRKHREALGELQGVRQKEKEVRRDSWRDTHESWHALIRLRAQIGAPAGADGASRESRGGRR